MDKLINLGTPLISATFSQVVRPPLLWPWDGSNYPSRSCNGPDEPKGPKYKQNKQTKFTPLFSAYLATFPRWFARLCFGGPLGRDPITPPGPAMVLIDRNNPNSKKTKQTNLRR